ELGQGAPPGRGRIGAEAARGARLLPRRPRSSGRIVLRGRHPHDVGAEDFAPHRSAARRTRAGRIQGAVRGEAGLHEGARRPDGGLRLVDYAGLRTKEHRMARSGGFSRARLGRMHDVMADHVAQGDAPGIVTLLSRHGDVHVDAIGTKAVGGSEPMQRDTIFRITSMTKPVTAVAAMILVEECTLRLDEPLDDTVPAHRMITLRDLLTFRLGLGVIMGPSADYPIQKALNELQLVGFGPPNVAAPYDPDEWMRRLGTLPLMHHPGEKWMYNTGSYVLGVLIARAAGQPLEAFFRERIFAPLGMKDTSFSVPSE